MRVTSKFKIIILKIHQEFEINQYPLFGDIGLGLYAAVKPYTLRSTYIKFSQVDFGAMYVIMQFVY